MNRKRPAWFAPYFQLPAGDRAIAQHADALIVERVPFPTHVGGLEKRQFFFWEKCCIHFESGQITARRFAT